MNLDELRRRTEQLDPKLSADAVALLKLVVRLSAEGKVKNSIMQNEIPDLLESVERSEEIHREIEKRKFFLQSARLINSTSSVKLGLSDNTQSNGEKKSAIDKKINSIVDKVNKLLRENGPLDIDFKYQITSDGIIILSYIGKIFDVLQLPDHIDGRPVVAIADRAFQGNSMRLIHLPAFLLELGEGAFQNCTKLEKVTLQARLAHVPNNCFKNCTSLKEINLNDGLRVIGKAAFQNVAATRIVFPKSVQIIDEAAFRVSQPLSAMFEVDNKKLNVSETAFSASATLYYRNSDIEEILKKTPAKVSGNVAEFLGDAPGATRYKVRNAVKKFFTFIAYAIGAVLIGAFYFIRTPVGLCVTGGATIYFVGNFVYDKFFLGKDRLLKKVGSVAVQLNDTRGVDQTVEAYNSTMQGLYELALKNSPDRAALFKELFIKSCVLEESYEGSAYYYATLNNDDYICFQANGKGYISAAYIWLDEKHGNIVTPVLAVTLQSVVNVSFEEEFQKELFAKLAEDNGNVKFHSLQAKRDFQVASAKKPGKLQYIIKAFIK